MADMFAKAVRLLLHATVALAGATVEPGELAGRTISGSTLNLIGETKQQVSNH